MPHSKNILAMLINMIFFKKFHNGKNITDLILEKINYLHQLEQIIHLGRNKFTKNLTEEDH